MIYNLINVASIIAGGFIGIVFKKHIPERVTDNLFKAVGLAIIFIGVNMFVVDTSMLLVVISIVVGTLIGALIDIDRRVNRLGRKVDIEEEGSASTSQAFIFATVLFCAGSMSIIGSLEAGLGLSGDTLLTKSVIDGISSIIYGASLGIGVPLAAISALLYQGLFVMLAQFLSPYLGAVALNLISAVGGILILGIGIKMISNLELKVSNMLPAILVPIILALLGLL